MLASTRTTLRWLGLALGGLCAACFASSCDDRAVVEPTPEPCGAADAEACRVDQMGCSVLEGEVRCEPCARGHYVDAEGACAPIAGTPMSHAFAEFTSQPGEEILGLCQSWTLGNETDVWIHGVELVQDELSHHSNWTFSPEDAFPGEDGVWPCAERDYDQLTAAVKGGVIYAQSTQATREVQRFPTGAAVRIPARSRIIGDVHVLNTTDAAHTGRAELTLYAIDAADVTTPLAPFHLTYDELAIPPHGTSRFSGTCDLSESWAASLGGQVSMKLHYGLPHTHALGSRFFLRAVGGPRDGETLLDVRGFNGEARGRFYEPAVDLTGITGLEFGCEFDNPRGETVGWGFGDQEMCEMLGFVESPVGFESRISEATPTGTDGDVQTFTGACSTLMIPWQDKL